MTRSATPVVALTRALSTGELAVERGLDRAQVQQRLTDGRGNRTIAPTSRSTWSIVRANVLTRFNALLGALCEAGEGASVEFEASLRWDVNERHVNKALERVVTKTVAGFLNGRGGTLLIGVDDAGAAVGFSDDYASLNRPDRDGFERHLLQILVAGLGGQARRFFAVDFATVDGQEVCALSVRPADAPTYLRDGAEPRLYVRTGNATTPLALDDAVRYVGGRWPGKTTGPLLDALLWEAPVPHQPPVTSTGSRPAHVGPPGVSSTPS
jgi:hypothetical protein